MQKRQTYSIGISHHQSILIRFFPRDRVHFTLAKFSSVGVGTALEF